MFRTRPGSLGTTATWALSDGPYGATRRSRRRGRLVGIRTIHAHSILNHSVKVFGVQAISDCSLGELRVVLRLVSELEKVPAVCKDGRIIVAHATIDLIPGKDGEGADGAAVTYVGVGAPWQGTACLPGDAGEPF
jgi:hypothetical protein